MTAPFILYGAPASGATPVHAALTLISLPVDIVDVAPWQGDGERQKLAAINPLRQVPVLVLPSGEVMTESAAMLTWLADRYPAAGLAPRIDDPMRAQFLRWMSFVSSAIYPLFWVRDVPSRLAITPEGESAILDRTAERIAQCWRDMDMQLQRGHRYLLGDTLGVLDLYVTVLSRWEPRRVRFYREAPHMAEVVRRVDADTRLAAFWAARYPFVPGWETLDP